VCVDVLLASGWMEKGGSWPGLWGHSMSYAVCTKLDWWIGVCCAVLGVPSFMAD